MPPTGPTTPEGKAISARNSTRHGLRARAIVLPGESQDDWDAFERAYIEDLAPIGISEEMLARRAAELLWRLRRVAAAERDAVEGRIAEPDDYVITKSRRYGRYYKQPDFIPDYVPESLPAVSALNPIMRYEAHLSRQYQQVIRDLQSMQDRRNGNRARITRVEVHGFPGNTAKPLAAVTIPAQPVNVAQPNVDLNGSQPPLAVRPEQSQTPDLPNELPSTERDQYPPSFNSAAQSESATMCEENDPSPNNTTLSPQRERVGPKGRGEGPPPTPKLPNELPADDPPDDEDPFEILGNAYASIKALTNDPEAGKQRLDILRETYTRLERRRDPSFKPRWLIEEELDAEDEEMEDAMRHAPMRLNPHPLRKDLNPTSKAKAPQVNA